ncbi:MAG: bifunctional folylpolyglutamate synthase/dihydrofolate synthase [Clostridia bacterium]|nr:bifunctional folylpolyglutamate synthase/dihydrofolate synthase [Clostridia bacterium]
MTIEEAIKYIKCVSSLGTKPGLERITALLDLLGNPEKELRIIHVAGTNGKGSFSAMISSVLREAGFSVGLYTSPHLVKYNERISLNGKDISDGELSGALEKIVSVSEKMKEKYGAPSEFEILTAIAFEFFAEKKPDFCVIECGMGGRWDATNVSDRPLLSVITGVALDHTAYLGDTVEKIAGEKAGIIKPGRPVLFGGNSREALGVISKAATSSSSSLTVTDRREIGNAVYSARGTRFSYRGKEYELGLVGHYQPFNAANVIEATEILRSEGVKIPEKALFMGLKNVRWKGRFERMNDDPPIYFDGGHNPEGVSEAVQSVREIFGGRVNLITGMLRDKDYGLMISEMATVAAAVFTVTPDSPRALDRRETAAEFEKLGVRAEACGYMKVALRKAVSESKRNGFPVLCLGSLYSYAGFSRAVTEIRGRAE